MLPVMLWVLLAQSAPAGQRGPVAVVVSSRRAGAETYAAKLSTRVHATLLREGWPDALDDEKTGKRIKDAGFSDARNCQGGQSCLTKLAVLLGPRAVLVSVDVGKVAKQLAVHLEAISAEGGASLAVSDFSAPVDQFGDQSAVPITLFVRELVQRLAEPAVAPTPPVPADAPVAALPPPPVVPAAQPAASLTEEPQAGGKRSLVLPVVLLSGAVAALAVSAAFGVLGLQDKRAFDAATFTVDGMQASSLPQSELDALASRGNTRFTVALISLVLAVGLGAASSYFFIAD